MVVRVCELMSHLEETNVKKYKYITCGMVDIQKPVSHYRLLSGNQIGTEISVLRIEIPEDLILLPEDNYSVTDDDRLISELHPVVCIRRYQKGLKKRPDLNNIPLHELSDYLQEHEHLYTTRFGYATKEEEVKLLYAAQERAYKSLLTIKNLEPFTQNRTLVYGYTCRKETFHTYLKDGEIHTVVYQTDYIERKIRPVGMREIDVRYNSDYIPDAFAYPDLCDSTFFEQLAKAGVKLPFTMYIERRLLETYKEHGGKYEFYGYVIEDSDAPVPRVSWEEAVQSQK